MMHAKILVVDAGIGAIRINARFNELQAIFLNMFIFFIDVQHLLDRQNGF